MAKQGCKTPKPAFPADRQSLTTFPSLLPAPGLVPGCWPTCISGPDVLSVGLLTISSGLGSVYAILVIPLLLEPTTPLISPAFVNAQFVLGPYSAALRTPASTGNPSALRND